MDIDIEVDVSPSFKRPRLVDKPEYVKYYIRKD